jgi:hypothetical protein
VTLLAIHVLTEVFADKEDEWTLLVQKAKAFLKIAGIAKPEKIFSRFTLELVQ